MTAAENETTRMETEEKQEQEDPQQQTEVQLEDVSAGGRVRRATQKFTIVEEKKEDEFTPPVGSGTKLRDIPVAGDKVQYASDSGIPLLSNSVINGHADLCVEVAELGKKHVEVLKALYLVFYGRRFQIKNVRGNRTILSEIYCPTDPIACAAETHQGADPRVFWHSIFGR